MSTLSPPLKWHGGKTYLADRIIALMRPHVHYHEPYFGGGAMLLAKDYDGISEVVNDVNGNLTNFWRVLQCPVSFVDFERIAQASPCCEAIYEQARARIQMGCEEPNTKCIACAVCFFIACRQSRAATFKDFTTIAKTRTRRQMNELPSAWMTAIDGLPAVHSRLQRVVILNRDALESIRTQDGPATLHYLDPPYWPESRATPDVYAYEMTQAQHIEMLDLIPTCKGAVVLSGYRNAEYDARLKNWNRTDFNLPNNAAGGDTKRRMIESVWRNY